MIQVCIFLPFLNPETPRPQNIPKSDLKLDYLKPNPYLIQSIVKTRQDIMEHLSKKSLSTVQKNNNKFHPKEMTGIPELEPFNEEDELNQSKQFLHAIKQLNNSYQAEQEYQHSSSNLSQYKQETQNKSSTVSQNGKRTHYSNDKSHILAQSTIQNRVNQGQQLKSNFIALDQNNSSLLQKPKSQSLNRRARRNIQTLNQYGQPIKNQTYESNLESPEQLQNLRNLPNLENQLITAQSGLNYQFPQYAQNNVNVNLNRTFYSQNNQNSTSPKKSQNSNKQDIQSIMKNQEIIRTTKSTERSALTHNSQQPPNTLQLKYAKLLQERSDKRANDLQENLVKQFKTDINVNMKLRNDIDKNIQKILDQSTNNFSILYHHPKLVNQQINRSQRNTVLGRQQTQYSRANSSNTTGSITSNKFQMTNYNTMIKQDVKSKLLDLNKSTL
eukprot:403346968